jgi:2-C-methyl-D-erythritol 2,4-cyclodiphosphate synthase
VKAYRENPNAFLATDESSLVESVGGQMKVHPHSGWNVKVTTPEDLKLAEGLLSVGATRRVAPTIKIGFGRDTHRLVKGRKLYLGGVHIPFEKGALGHSDGDALLHAVADAILGATGSGDIGEWFSDKSPRFKGIRSEKILRKVLEEARQRGWVPQQMDSVITLERPRLGNRKKEIRKKLARMTGLPEASISIKAKTAEGLGPEGEGLAVTCEALAVLKQTGKGTF